MLAPARSKVSETREGGRGGSALGVQPGYTDGLETSGPWLTKWLRGFISQ
jgi:hypothetical protein